MAKSHPLLKIEFLLAVLWAIPFFVFSNAEESKQATWFLVSIIPFFGLSIVSIYIGWLMAIKKEDVISPFESLAIRFTEKTHGKQAAKNLLLQYSKPSRKILMGGMSIFSGLLCLVFAIIGTVMVFRFL